MSGNELLDRAGTISREMAENKVEEEYHKYKAKTEEELSEVEMHYLESVKKVQKQIEKVYPKENKS